MMVNYPMKMFLDNLTSTDSPLCYTLIKHLNWIICNFSTWFGDSKLSENSVNAHPGSKCTRCWVYFLVYELSINNDSFMPLKLGLNIYYTSNTQKNYIINCVTKTIISAQKTQCTYQLQPYFFVFIQTNKLFYLFSTFRAYQFHKTNYYYYKSYIFWFVLVKFWL